MSFDENRLLRVEALDSLLKVIGVREDKKTMRRVCAVDIRQGKALAEKNGREMEIRCAEVAIVVAAEGIVPDAVDDSHR